jgi:hypothetical protein
MNNERISHPSKPGPAPIYTLATNNPSTDYTAWQNQSNPGSVQYPPLGQAQSYNTSQAPPGPQYVPPPQQRKYSNPGYPGAPPMDGPFELQPQEAPNLTKGYILPHELCPVDGQPHDFRQPQADTGGCCSCGLPPTRSRIGSQRNRCVKCGKPSIGKA